jgi:hypothetical protein
VTDDKPEWNVYREGPYIIWAPKGYRLPMYVRKKPCKECGRVYYSEVKYLRIGEWTGEITEEFGPWLSRLMKGVKNE